MSNNRPPNGIPSQAEFNLRRVFMITEQGYTPQQANDAIGQTPNGRSREKINRDNEKWLRGEA